MNRNRLLAVMAMLVMSCLIFAQGPARDPKTGRFIKKTHTSSMTGHTQKGKTGPSAAWKKAHPRDAKTGKFIKKSKMGGHSLPARDPKTGRFMKSGKGHMSTMSGMGAHRMNSHMKPAKKPGMMSKIKSLFHKKPKS